MLYPKQCYNEPCYKEVEVYFSIFTFSSRPVDRLVGTIGNGMVGEQGGMGRGCGVGGFQIW